MILRNPVLAAALAATTLLPAAALAKTTAADPRSSRPSPRTRSARRSKRIARHPRLAQAPPTSYLATHPAARLREPASLVGLDPRRTFESTTPRSAAPPASDGRRRFVPGRGPRRGRDVQDQGRRAASATTVAPSSIVASAATRCGSRTSASRRSSCSIRRAHAYPGRTTGSQLLPGRPQIPLRAAAHRQIEAGR